MNNVKLFMFSSLIMLFLVLIVGCKSQSQDQSQKNGGNEYALHSSSALSDKGAVIRFTDSTTIDFGSIDAGDTVTHKFYFINDGNEPLVIKSATATCGCTVAYFNKQPINSGQRDSIVATFISSENNKGFQNKVVTIESNSPLSPIQLTMYGKVK